MRSISKKFRARMIIGCILVIIALMAVSVVILSISLALAELPVGSDWKESENLPITEMENLKTCTKLY